MNYKEICSEVLQFDESALAFSVFYREKDGRNLHGYGKAGPVKLAADVLTSTTRQQRVMIANVNVSPMRLNHQCQKYRNLPFFLKKVT